MDHLLLVPLLAWLAVAAISCFGVYHSQRDRRPIVSRGGPPAVLIIPIRGVPPRLAELWQGIQAQTYRPFRVIFAVESAADPAHAALMSLPDGPPVEIVVAGATTQRGQKVHNTLAALRTLRPDDAIIVFADADIVPAPDWLARLIRSLNDRVVDIGSGNRWLMPTDNRWATAFVCVISSSISTVPRLRPFNVAWGGSMVMHRQAVAALEIEQCWDLAVLDDLPLTRAVLAHGGRVNGPRDALVPSPVAYSWKEAIAFGRRQYLFVRMHAPAQWMLAATATTIPLLGWAVALPLAVTGSKTAIGVIVAANVLDHMRAYFRRRVPRKLWGMEISPRVAWLDRWATPAWLAVHAFVIWSTLFGRRITWANRTYVLDSRQRVVRIIGGAESP